MIAIMKISVTISFSLKGGVLPKAWCKCVKMFQTCQNHF